MQLLLWFAATHSDLLPSTWAGIQSVYTLVTTLIQRRKGTRVRAQIPLRITSLDPSTAFTESCHTLLVNPLGCGVRFPRSLKPGMRVRVDDLPGGGSITARVASNLPPGDGSKYWIVGIGWDAPGNLCCLAPVPADWQNYADVPRFFPAGVRCASANDVNDLASRG